ALEPTIPLLSRPPDSPGQLASTIPASPGAEVTPKAEASAEEMTPVARREAQGEPGQDRVAAPGLVSSGAVLPWLRRAPGRYRVGLIVGAVAIAVAYFATVGGVLRNQDQTKGMAKSVTAPAPTQTRVPPTASLPARQFVMTDEQRGITRWLCQVMDADSESRS